MKKQTKPTKPKEVVIEEVIHKMHAVDRKREILCKQDEQTAPYMQQYVPNFGGIMPDYNKKARLAYIKSFYRKNYDWAYIAIIVITVAYFIIRLYF